MWDCGLGRGLGSGNAHTPWVVMGSSRGTWEPNSPSWPLTASALREALMFVWWMNLDGWKCDEEMDLWTRLVSVWW